eukprot:456688-Pleurochrysis_carterae.AAC.4
MHMLYDPHRAHALATPSRSCAHASARCADRTGRSMWKRRPRTHARACACDERMRSPLCVGGPFRQVLYVSLESCCASEASRSFSLRGLRWLPAVAGHTRSLPLPRAIACSLSHCACPFSDLSAGLVWLKLAPPAASRVCVTGARPLSFAHVTPCRSLSPIAPTASRACCPSPSLSFTLHPCDPACHTSFSRFMTLPRRCMPLYSVPRAATLFAPAQAPCSSLPLALFSWPFSGFNPWLGACQSNLLIGPRTPKPAVAQPPTRLPKQLPSRSATYLLNPILSMHADAMQQAVGGSRRGSVRPSTGLLGLMLGLAMCESTTLFGFGNDTDSSTAGTCNHYWECKYDQTRYFSGKMGNHDWHAQWRVISQLAEREIVRYHASTRNVSV